MHDTIGCYLDIDKGHIKFSKNGKLSVNHLIREDMCNPIFVIFKNSLTLFSASPSLPLL